ncbi:MAG: phosphopantothenate/pantothenate synthetase [Candidatus Lokiarchaeota archaeon]|nr:phosphopantothenate/pantothenate synthetase [Candidatus Lokiarchaeota archaeon]
MKPNDNKSHTVPKTHPRYSSLQYRHKIIEGMKNLVVAEAGLIAHGRGECFDYIIGEKTNKTAKNAIRAAVALLLIAKRPVISVNGNVAALVPKELAILSKLLDIPLEINLFYMKEGRVKAITDVLKNAGATDIRGTNETVMTQLEGLESNRRKVDLIGKADVVMVPLEDGDRTEALKKLNKLVIAIDLNPLSRTALWADITIVDNIIRVIPEMIETAKKLKKLKTNEVLDIVDNFNNKLNIQKTLDLIIEYITIQKEEAFKILER